MSNASDALANYLQPYIKDIHKHYEWSFDEAKAKLLTGRNYSVFPDWYSKTVQLKQDLRAMLEASTNTDTRFHIARYYIEDWGRVSTNKSLRVVIDALSERLVRSNSDFHNIPLKGVSSWSKYLCLCCDRAAIYDSRVAYSINAIRYMAGDADQFFPIPEGRRPRLTLIDIETLFVVSLLKSGALDLEKDFRHRQFSARAKKRFHIDDNQTYSVYLQLLDDTAKALGLPRDEFYKVEMLLFALAPGKVLADLIMHVHHTSA